MPSHTNPHASEIETTERIEELRDDWHKMYRRWWSIHYATGICGAISAIAVTQVVDWTRSNGDARWQFLPWALGAASAISTALVTFLGPLQKAERFSQAFHAIDHAVLLHRAEVITLAQLLNELNQARKLVLHGVSASTGEIAASTAATAPAS